MSRCVPVALLSLGALAASRWRPPWVRSRRALRRLARLGPTGRVAGRVPGGPSRPSPAVPGWDRLVAVAARIGLVSRREARVEGALPPVLDAVAGARRAGAATPQALGAGRLVARGPLRDDLDAVLDAVAAGVPLRDALSAWRVRTPAPGVKLVVAALSLAAEVGGSGAAPIEAVAASVRDRLAAQREARALATTARLSVGVMAAVPPLFAVLLASAEPGGLDFFVGTPLGIACLVLGVALDGAGAWWMRRIAGSVT